MNDALSTTNSQLKCVHVTTNGAARDATDSTYFLLYKTAQTYFGTPHEAHSPVW